MAAKKKAIGKPVKKAAAKKATGKKAAAKKAVKATGKTTKSARSTVKPSVKPIGEARPASHVIYVDSCFFFPTESANGYVEYYQEGRFTSIPENTLRASIPLPVGAVMNSITIYYKNTTQQDMTVAILKKHIDHHAYSGEYEVSLDFLPPASSVPDNFVEKFINHFDAGGLIKDKYLYFIEIYNTSRVNDTDVKTVRGMRVDYTY